MIISTDQLLEILGFVKRNAIPFFTETKKTSDIEANLIEASVYSSRWLGTQIIYVRIYG